MEQTIRCMTDAIAGVLAENAPSIYLYGSCTLGDFQPGWSDIDLLVLTQTPISIPQANTLLYLRQNPPITHPNATYTRACEGSLLSLDAFLKGYPSPVVYWGTSGQRLMEQYHPDIFSLWQLHRNGRLLYGADIRSSLPIPTASDLHAGVARHLQTILDHGRGGCSLYAFGWMLDVARGLYTLRHNAVIAKTAAGEWALSQGLCPDEGALVLALDVRRHPARLQEDAVLREAELLTPAIQSFAEVLRRELEQRGIPIPD